MSKINKENNSYRITNLSKTNPIVLDIKNKEKENKF